ncbi:TPA: ferredoxin [Candidatus Dojkabacteria bacterium]|jgi:ferredoxin|uniref:Ferredoxin n=1 Tax=Candidatus Dojkabacteria bacterium TaxID=2099670 RepID=A0A832R8I6_9BACT|nr:ferredoxin [Candidatus Dojkabacteria bacterium]
MVVTIKKDACVMCGSCVALCPEVFEMKDDGTVDVKAEYQGKPIEDEAIKEKVKQAANACPTTAIEIKE